MYGLMNIGFFLNKFSSFPFKKNGHFCKDSVSFMKNGDARNWYVNMRDKFTRSICFRRNFHTKRPGKNTLCPCPERRSFEKTDIAMLPPFFLQQVKKRRF